MITTLVGGQYGSEGKGLVAAKLADRFDIHVRTGAPNAGHTYYVNNPESLDQAFAAGAPADVLQQGITDEQAGRDRVKVVARSIPCGAANPEATLVIGPGGLIDVDLLISEIDELQAVGIDVRDRLVIDPRCGTIHPDWHHAFEGGIIGRAHQQIGSTGEGVGPARMAKLARGTFDGEWAQFEQVDHIDVPWDEHGVRIEDTTMLLFKSLKQGANVLLEGTQGSGLSNITGPWPYCTSTDTNSAQLCADAGLSPRWVEDCILVCRTFPIRVAGNSGPLAHETSWEDIGVPEERTTVTKKVRRVGEFDADKVREAIRLNWPVKVALTFLDYVFPDAAKVEEFGDLSQEARNWVYAMEPMIGTNIKYLGTGPDSLIIRNGNNTLS